MNMKSTYVDRSPPNRNAAVIENALREINSITNPSRSRERREKKEKDLLPSGRVSGKAVALLRNILKADGEDLLRKLTIQEGEDKFVLPAKMRVGRPRTSWIIETARAAWKEWKVRKDNTSDEGQQDETEFQHNDSHGQRIGEVG